MSTKKRIRKPIESPRNAFDAARLISKAVENLYGGERAMAIRWGLEASGHGYPIKITAGWNQP